MFQPLFVRQLSSGEREELKRRSRASGKEGWRAEVILESADGKSAAEISRTLGFHSSNIKKWIRRFNESGLEGIALKRRGPQGGPKPKFSRTQTEQIIQLSKTEPSSRGYSFKKWTPQKLATAARELGIVQTISHVTVRRMLNESVRSGGVESSREGPDESSIRIKEGKDALASADFDGAARHFSSALADGPLSENDEAAVRAMLCQSFEELSRHKEANEVIRKYEDPQVVAELSPQARGRIKLRIGSVNSSLRNHPKAIASLNEATRVFLEVEDNLGASEAHYLLGRTYILINEFRIARDHLFAAVKFQRTNVNRELLARIYDRLGAVDFYEGAFSISKENYLKALELADGSPNKNLVGMILLNLSTTLDEGHLDERRESAKYIKRAIEYLEEGGHKDFLVNAYANLGDNLRYSGHMDEAIESLNKAIEITKRFPHPEYEATARITLAEILCVRGGFEQAESHLRKSLELIEAGTDKWLESNALTVLASIHRATDRTEAALKTLRKAMQISMSIGDLHGVTLAQVALAEYHFGQGGLDQAREYLELAQGRLKDDKSLTISGLIQRLTGQIQASIGRLAEARQHIAQSISIFTTTEIPFELARSHHEMGLLLQKAGDPKLAEHHLSQAERIFKNLGALPAHELASKALAAVASGEKSEPEVARVSPANGVLLMQRLIEASASRDLLLQELASVVYDYFPVDTVVICRVDESHRLEPLLSHGVGSAEAANFCNSIDSTLVRAGGKSGNVHVVRLGDGPGASVALTLRASHSLDFSQIAPLIRQTEFGLENCALRVSARKSAATVVEPRIKTIIPGFICCSPVMFDVIERIHKIRTSDVTVLITGESGTGKELVARAIHAESARARAIFLPFNCTATPKEIIDSQLFGHRRGAFTGATNNYPGIIRAAEGGTLFLDEIGDLSLEVQPKLMRFLQEGEVQPLGETKPIRVDVRVLAATNTELERAVSDGRFREDLFHRLNIIRIHVPPLRERTEEVSVLAQHFLDHFSSRSGKPNIRLTNEALGALTEYDWPGNVRQLRNEVERVVAYATEGASVSVDDLSPEVARPHSSVRSRPLERSRLMTGSRGWGGNGAAGDGAAPVPNGLKLKEATAALERRLIQEALARNNGNLSRTAQELGLSRRGLRLKLGQLGINREEPRSRKLV